MKVYYRDKKLNGVKLVVFHEDGFVECTHINGSKRNFHSRHLLRIEE